MELSELQKRYDTLIEMLSNKYPLDRNFGINCMDACDSYIFGDKDDIERTIDEYLERKSHEIHNPS